MITLDNGNKILAFTKEISIVSTLEYGRLLLLLKGNVVTLNLPAEYNKVEIAPKHIIIAHSNGITVYNKLGDFVYEDTINGSVQWFDVGVVDGKTVLVYCVQSDNRAILFDDFENTTESPHILENASQVFLCDKHLVASNNNRVRVYDVTSRQQILETNVVADFIAQNTVKFVYFVAPNVLHLVYMLGEQFRLVELVANESDYNCSREYVNDMLCKDVKPMGKHLLVIGTSPQRDATELLVFDMYNNSKYLVGHKITKYSDTVISGCKKYIMGKLPGGVLETIATQALLPQG
jgi:hypothetical protein